MLKIQEFIDCFEGDVELAFDCLKKKLKIDSTIYTLEDKNNVHDVIFLQPSLRADMTNPLVREANCLVFDDAGDVMAKSYDHPVVVDMPEKLPTDFSLTGTICEEVADGTVVVVYNIEGTWFVGTGSSPDAMDYLPGMSLPTFTFENEIKSLLSRRFSRWDRPFENMNPFMCFVFNYVNPYANKVMPILAPELYLTGVINLEDNTELSNGVLDSLAKRMDITRPTWTEVNGNSSLVQRLLNMRTLAPGLSLRDRSDNRVFIANPIYKAVKCAKEAGDKVRPTHIAKILQVCRDKADVMAIVAAYDGFGPLLDLLWKVKEELYGELVLLWNTAHHKKNVRDFVDIVQHHPLSHILFMYKNKTTTSIRDELDDLKPIKLTRLAENKWEKEYDSASKLLKFAGGTDGDSETGKKEDWGSEEDWRD